MVGYAKEVLIDPEMLEAHLDDADLRIVEVDEKPELYSEAHIPGAIGFDWKRDLQDVEKRDFLGPEEFSALFGAKGIGNEHMIVLYGDRSNWFAAYTYWYLKYCGYEDVYLLNGPREKWISDGHPVTRDVPSYHKETFSVDSCDEGIRARHEEVFSGLEGGAKLVDVRLSDEYAGEMLSPPGCEQEGEWCSDRISGAVSIPWTQAVKEDGTFKPADELRELYSQKGVLGEDVIAYCRIGDHSAHTWFVLHELLGQDRVKNYDGS